MNHQAQTNQEPIETRSQVPQPPKGKDWLKWLGPTPFPV